MFLLMCSDVKVQALKGMPRCWDVLEHDPSKKACMRPQQRVRELENFQVALRQGGQKLLLSGPVNYFMLGVKLRDLSVSADIKPLTYVKSATTTRSHNEAARADPPRSPSAGQTCLKLALT